MKPVLGLGHVCQHGGAGVGRRAGKLEKRQAVLGVRLELFATISLKSIVLVQGKGGVLSRKAKDPLNGENLRGKHWHRGRRDSGALCRKYSWGAKVGSGQRGHCEEKHSQGVRMRTSKGNYCDNLYVYFRLSDNILDSVTL